MFTFFPHVCMDEYICTYKYIQMYIYMYTYLCSYIYIYIRRSFNKFPDFHMDTFIESTFMKH